MRCCEAGKERGRSRSLLVNDGTEMRDGVTPTPTVRTAAPHQSNMQCSLLADPGGLTRDRKVGVIREDSR